MSMRATLDKPAPKGENLSMRNFFTILSVLMFFLVPVAKAEEPRAALEKAEQEYRAGNFAAAAAAIRSVDVPGEAAKLYNLAAAEFRAGEVGKAYAHLLHARKLAPTDAEIRQNLQFVQSRLEAQSRAVAPADWQSFLPAWLTEHPEIILTVALAVLALALLRRVLFALAGAAALALVLGWLFLQWSGSERAVITAKTVLLRSGPAESFSEITSLAEGSLVSVEERKASWAKLSFQRAGEKSKEVVGWVEETAITSLTPEKP